MTSQVTGFDRKCGLAARLPVNRSLAQAATTVAVLTVAAAFAGPARAAYVEGSTENRILWAATWDPGISAVLPPQAPIGIGPVVSTLGNASASVSFDHGAGIEQEGSAGGDYYLSTEVRAGPGFGQALARYNDIRFGDELGPRPAFVFTNTALVDRQVDLFVNLYGRLFLNPVPDFVPDPSIYVSGIWSITADILSADENLSLFVGDFFAVRNGGPTYDASYQDGVRRVFTVPPLQTLSVTFRMDASVGATSVPEPSTWAMLIAGFGLVGLAARRRSSRPA